MSAYYKILRPHLLPLLFLLSVTAATFARILGHEFIINWDDAVYITDNDAVHGFSVEHIRTVFNSFYLGNYAPIQMLSYMLDFSLWGLKPAGYFFSNLLLHALNGLLAYYLLIKMHNTRLVATISAFIFLVHPVQVESVAWASQRKNLLAMLFFLMAWVGYLCYREEPAGKGRKAYALSVVLFVLSLLSKSVTVILPVVLIVFDRCYPVAIQRFRHLDKIPYVLAAGAVAALSLLSQTPDYSVWGGGGGRLVGYHGGSAMATLWTMLPVGCHYLKMLLMPVGLSAEYTPVIHQTFDSAVLGAVLILAVVGVLSGWLLRINRRLGFWSLYFWIGLLPVSQIVPLVTLMNDRYLYFPLLGASVLVAAGVSFLHDACNGIGRMLLSVVMGLLLVMLPAVAFQRTAVWNDAVSLWSDTVAKTPGSPNAWEKLGEAYHSATPPMQADAVRALQTALALAPSSEASLYNLGLLYTELGRYGQASGTLGRLIQLYPDHVMGLAALGNVKRREGLLDEAEAALRRAHDLQPDAMQVVRSLADVLFVRKRDDAARTFYMQLEANRWGDEQTAFALAWIEARKGQVNGAVDWLEKALARGFQEYDEIAELCEVPGLQDDLRCRTLLRKSVPRHKVK